MAKEAIKLLVKMKFVLAVLVLISCCGCAMKTCCRKPVTTIKKAPSPPERRGKVRRDGRWIYSGSGQMMQGRIRREKAARLKEEKKRSE